MDPDGNGSPDLARRDAERRGVELHPARYRSVLLVLLLSRSGAGASGCALSVAFVGSRNRRCLRFGEQYGEGNDIRQRGNFAFAGDARRSHVLAPRVTRSVALGSGDVFSVVSAEPGVVSGLGTNGG